MSCLKNFKMYKTNNKLKSLNNNLVPLKYFIFYFLVFFSQVIILTMLTTYLF